MKYCCVLWIIIWTIIAQKSSGATISLKEGMITIDGNKIYLGEIATITDEDSRIIEELNQIYVGPMPLVGRTKVVGQNYIQARIFSQYPSMKKLSWVGNESVKISRKSQQIDLQQIVDMAWTYLKTLPIKEGERVTFEVAKEPDLCICPTGKVTFEIVNGPEVITNLMSIPVKVSIGEDFSHIFKVQFKAMIFKQVVVANHILKKGTIIFPEDARIQECPIQRFLEEPITEISAVIGKQTIKKIDSGEILTFDLLEVPPTIMKGDIVAVKNEIDNLVVTTMGKACESGRMGERIEVRNIDSNRRIYAIVINSGEVEVK